MRLLLCSHVGDAAQRRYAKLWFAADDFHEVAGVWNGENPETSDELVLVNEPHPEGAPTHDLPESLVGSVSS